MATNPKLGLIARWLEAQHLDPDRLLAEWRWLCPGPKKIAARSAFGDLFLADDEGQILRLDVSVGNLEKIADSETEFRKLLEDPEKRQAWFAETDEKGFAEKGLIPSDSQCVGFDIPLVLAEGGVRRAYLADIYEYLSFLGELSQQIAGTPNGGKVRLVVKPRSLATDH